MDHRHTDSVALRARFAGLGIAAFASVTLLSSLPRIAQAEELLPQDELPPAGTELASEDLGIAVSSQDGDSVPEAIDEPASTVGSDDLSAAGESEDDVTHTEAPQAIADEVVEGPVTERDQSQDDAADDMTDSSSAQDDVMTTVEVDAAATPSASSAPRKAAPDEGGEDTGDPSGETQDPQPEPEPVPEPKNGWETNSKGKTYYYKNDVRQTGWVKTDINPITGKKGATCTYWLDSSGVLAKGRVITPLVKRDAAAGKYAYALSDGSIAMGRTVTVDGKIYIANKKGALIGLTNDKKSGFIWRTNVGGTETRERYFLYRINSGSAKGAYYAVQGYSTDGYEHYTRKQGFVIRGVLKTGSKKGSRIYLATDKGKLASLESGAKRGWIVSSNWGAKDKRYYLYLDTKTANKGIYYAKLGYSTNGYAHYTTANGYVRTKSWSTKDSRIYIVNKQGKMATLRGKASDGWLESSQFVKGTKRYYLYRNTESGLASGAYYAIKGFTTEGIPHFTYKNGTALTGIKTVDDHIYIAKNTGEMLALTGDASEGATKLVDYGQGKHLYYLYRETSGTYAGAYYVRPGFGLFKGGKNQGHYTTKKGYLLTGVRRSGKKVFIASKEGVLLTLGSGREKGWCQGDFGQGEQKYYLYKITTGAYAGAYYAQRGFSSDGGDHYTTSKGYALRNACKKYKGVWYYADDKGSFTKLTKGKIGWQNPSQYYQVSAFNVNNLPANASGFFTYITPSRIAPDASRSVCVETFIKRAMEYMGTEYKWDWAMRPGEGVDCAGLVMQALYAVGINTPYNTYSHMYDPWQDHNAENMRTDKKFKQIPFAQRQRGDLIFYQGHVGIYLGNDQIINAYPPHVQIQSVHSWTVTGCSRVFV